MAWSSDVAASSIAFSAFVVNSFTFVTACSFSSEVKELLLISSNLFCLCESNAALFSSVTSFGTTVASFFPSSWLAASFESLFVEGAISLFSTESFEGIFVAGCSICLPAFSSVWFEGVVSFASVAADVPAGVSTAGSCSLFVSVCFSTVVLSFPVVVGAELSTFSSDFSAGVGDVGASSEVEFSLLSVGEVVSFLSTSPFVVSFGIVPSVCFFSFTGFEGVVSFASVAAGVSAAGACSAFCASTLPVVAGVWATFAVSFLPIVAAFSTGWLDTKVWFTFEVSSLTVTTVTCSVFGTACSPLVVGFTSVTTVSVFPDCVSSFVVTSKAFTSSCLFWRLTTVTVCFETVWFPIVVEIGCVNPSSLCAYIKLTLVIWFICAKASIDIPVASLITLSVSPHLIT